MRVTPAILTVVFFHLSSIPDLKAGDIEEIVFCDVTLLRQNRNWGRHTPKYDIFNQLVEAIILDTLPKLRDSGRIEYAFTDIHEGDWTPYLIQAVKKFSNGKIEVEILSRSEIPRTIMISDATYLRIKKPNKSFRLLIHKMGYSVFSDG